MLYGVILDGINTLEKYGLALGADVKIGSPRLKETRVSIPGANGDLNLSYAVSGRPTFENRPLEFSLFRPVDDAKLTAVKSSLMNSFHGREVKIIFPFDRSRYFKGTLSVGDMSGYNSGRFPVSATVFPYKYEMTTSDGDWLWDDFNFESDVARNYDSLPVSGRTEYTVIGSALPAMPQFIVTSDDQSGLDVEIYGTSYHLVDGVSTIPGFFLDPVEYTFIFLGSGMVSIRFQGGEL